MEALQQQSQVSEQYDDILQTLCLGAISDPLENFLKKTIKSVPARLGDHEMTVG